MDDKRIGFKEFTPKRIKSQFLNRGKQTIKLENDNKWTAELQIMIEEMKSSSTIDYYATPIVSLAPDYEKCKDFEGLDVNVTSKVNTFSCWDNGNCCCDERDFELYPDKHQTRYDED